MTQFTVKVKGKSGPELDKVRSVDVGRSFLIISPYVPQNILRPLVQVKLNGIRVELAEIEASLSAVCQEMGLLYCSTVATSLRTFPIHCFGVFSFVLRHWCNELLIALSHFAVSYVLIALYHIFLTPATKAIAANTKATIETV